MVNSINSIPSNICNKNLSSVRLTDFPNNYPITINANLITYYACTCSIFLILVHSSRYTFFIKYLECARTGKNTAPINLLKGNAKGGGRGDWDGEYM